MTIEWIGILAANALLALGSVVQAATGLGAGVVVVPLLALISLDFIPGPVIVAALALAWLMAWRGRAEIHYAGMLGLLGGLLMGMILGASILALLPLDRLGILLGTVILLAVLCGGFFVLYRLGTKQIELARQQQDFVSAVSHELKTPLTSIRMYGEMLREGWATEEKRKTYYDYIHDESERLSRLIGNVLQLSRLTHNDLRLDLKPVSVSELIDGIRSKISSQIERAGFKLNLDCEVEAVISVDVDSFSQIIINLVDNAIKFSAAAQRRVIHISCRDQFGGEIQFAVRDYGPGIARDQMKKIFKLFYRAENELTRETIGTGIGLALVNQLAQAMDASVDVVNKRPGAEFRIVFPVSGRSGTG